MYGAIYGALCAVLLALLALSQARAEDRLDLESSTVTGNRELPKVMVIVPWKKANPGDLPGRPLHSLLDEALSPVDREVFRRRLEFHREVVAASGENDE
jgi:hypothetical protein